MLNLKTHCQKAPYGFTLAELLIALAIIGEIATFTIPKIISTTQRKEYNLKAKEASAMVAAAYHNYKMANRVDALTFTLMDLTPYFNYVNIESGNLIDREQGNTTFTCGAPYMCFKLHNGGVLQFYTLNCFQQSNTTNSIVFSFDPDGTTDGTTNGPGKGIQFYLYYDGYMTDRGNVKPNTLMGNWCPGGSTPTILPDSTKVPPWFSW